MSKALSLHVPARCSLLSLLALASSLAGPGAAAGLPEQTLTTGLMAHWPLDDGISNPAATLASEVIAGAQGTLDTLDPATTWLMAPPASRLGGALRLDGVAGAVTLPVVESLNPATNQVSVALWVNLDLLPSDLPAGFGGILDSAQDGYVLYLDRGNQELRFKVTDTAGHAARPGIPQDRLVPGEWAHITAVYDGNATAEAGEARIYLNGELVDNHIGSDGAGGTGLRATVRPDQIAALGRDGGEARYFLGCALDDVAIWRRALTAEEIRHLAAGNVVPTPPPPAKPMAFTVQPADAAVLEGTYATFRISVSDGIPPVTYQWKRDGVAIPGATAVQLQVLAGASTAGSYTATATDTRGSLESSAARLSFTPLAATPADSLRQGLAALWPMDDGLALPGTTNVVDLIHGNTGRMQSPDPASAWVSGAEARFGGALHVDGANTFVSILPSDSLNIPSDQVTVAAWVKLPSLPSELPEAFGGIFDAVQDDFVLYLDRAAKELRFKVTDARGHAARPGIPEAELVPGTWIHVAGVYNGRAEGSGGTATVYLNGQPADSHRGNDGSSGTGLTGFVRAGQSTALGRNGTETRYFLDAVIDDVAVWSRALSSAELGYLASGNPVPLPRNDAPIELLAPTRAAASIGLSWVGGRAPYQVQRRASLSQGAWENVGSPTDTTSASVPQDAAAGFFRVVSGIAGTRP